MERTLKILFDFQKLQGNERLSKLIGEVERTKKELSLEDLELVNAAGDSFDERRNKETDDSNRNKKEEY